MAVKHKKTWPELFEAVASGKKKFDIRVADFDLMEGDTLVLDEWDPKTEKYTGRKLEKKVGYILKGGIDAFGQRQLMEKYGFYVISLE